MKSIIKSWSFVLLAGFIAACGTNTGSAEKTPEQSSPKIEIMQEDNKVYEIAIRQVKNELSQFEEARAGFINIWLSSEGVSVDREFKAFYNIPQNEKPVFVGMTAWDSQEAFYAASQKHSNSEKAKAFFAEFDMLAFATLKPVEGEFDLSTLGKEAGNIVEMAVRRVKPENMAAFQTARKGYIEALNQVEGVSASYEFEIVMSGSGDNLTAGMTVYQDKNAFDKANETVNQSQLAKDYFSTFEIVSIQYVNSVK
ncbi:MAG: hypothetical protein MRZ79_13005 [Bacteroidia bacterium]|nr:hypothetical protein [Bacteroidia bacterium]